MSIDSKISRQNIQRAREDFLEMIRDDYTQFGYLAVFLRQNEPDLTSELVHRIAREIVSDLVNSEGIYDVDVSSEQPSDKTLAEILEDVDAAFRSSGGTPDIGDGPWFGVDLD